MANNIEEWNSDTIFGATKLLRTIDFELEAHPYEDCSCHLFVEQDKQTTTQLYAIFDGNDGSQVAQFALQRMAAEILLDSQLRGDTTDGEVKEVLRQAFVAVEKSYWDSVDDKLAERTSVLYEIPDEMTSYEAYQKFPHLVDKLNALNTQLSCGTTAVVALIHCNKLYVANVGDCRALLCKTDSNGVLRVVQLSVDHDLRNEDELLRLYKLGLDIESIRKGSRLGNQEHTRCVGNYLVKGGYKDLEDLCKATSEPVTAEPEVTGGIPLDETCCFLLLLSDGVYKTLQQATGCVHTVNKELTHMAVEQFRTQSTLTGVAQGVVDKIVRIHHDVFMSDANCQTSERVVSERDDMTLLVRNFNYPMPNALQSPSNPQVRFNPIVSTAPATNSYQSTNENEEAESDLTTTNEEATSTQDTSTTDSSDVYPAGDPMLRRNERIEPYVDFSEFYNNFEAARQNGTLPASLS